jgi:sn1-specific diacylglycerol lipase
MIFRGGDMTPSDILSGIILLNLKEVDQFNRENNRITVGSSRQNKQKSIITDRPLWMNINEAAYFIRYAVATYSWPYYVYMHNVRGLKEIFCSCRSYAECCCCCCSKSSSITPASNQRANDEHAAASEQANDESINVGHQMNSEIPVSSLTIHGDTRSQRHFRAFKFLSKINDCDLIYANFQNELFLVPFCIIIDHHKKSVVITIRGSLSLR